jgi:hypothetical protein
VAVAVAVATAVAAVVANQAALAAASPVALAAVVAVEVVAVVAVFLADPKRHFSVIASEAKQSQSLRAQRSNHRSQFASSVCFVAPLLAMTAPRNDISSY